MAAEDSKKLWLATAALFVGLLALAASLGFVGEHLAGLTRDLPSSSQPSIVAYGWLAIVAVMPALIELLLIRSVGRLSSRVVQALAIPALLFVGFGWVELFHLAPRLDRALLDGPGAWILMLPIGGAAILYVLFVLLPVMAVGVHLHSGRESRT